MTKTNEIKIWKDDKGNNIPVHQMKTSYISFLLRIIDAKKAGLKSDSERKEWKYELKREARKRKRDVTKVIMKSRSGNEFIKKYLIPK